MPRKSEKRERLIIAAKELFFKKGFNNTTLADIAEIALVPLGNIYYYFKSRDEFCAAVIQAYKTDIENMISKFSLADSAKDRLIAVVNFYADKKEEIARYGNMFINLIEELAKLNHSAVNTAQAVLNTMLNWLISQFKEFYPEDSAKIKAIEFLSKIYGLQTLTLIFQDSTIIFKHLVLIREQINSLSKIPA